MSGRRVAVADRIRVGQLAARLLAGRWFWLAAVLPLGWSFFHALRLFEGWSLQFGGREEAFLPVDAQNFLIGTPMIVLAIFLGVRVIAGEVDARRLEIAYTVPGGSQRVWIAKLTAAVVILLGSELLLALFTFVLLTSFPLSALYGALQTAAFYLALSMGLGALFKSEVTGVMVTVAILVLELLVPLGRFSPMWNPLTLPESTEASQVVGWAVQNRIGFLLVMAAIVALAFGRAERREKMLAG